MLILYAEDDIEDYYLFLEVLESIHAGANCINVVNGLDAIKFLDDCVALPDYVFLDINMPAMDGKACLRAIKRDPRLKIIPTVIYTTSKNPLDEEYCRELNVLAYLPKPNSINEAKASLQKVFNL